MINRIRTHRTLGGLLLVILISGISANEINQEQEAALLKQIESSTDIRVRAKLVQILEDLRESEGTSENLLYCTVTKTKGSDEVRIDYKENRIANTTTGEIVAKGNSEKKHSTSFEILAQPDGYVRRLGQKKMNIYKFEVTPIAYTFSTKTFIPGGQHYQLNRITGELTAHEGKGLCKKAQSLEPQF